jgi:hypothetical protein
VQENAMEDAGRKICLAWIFCYAIMGRYATEGRRLRREMDAKEAPQV